MNSSVINSPAAISPEYGNSKYPDLSNILEKCETMVKGVCFEIIVQLESTGEEIRYLVEVDNKNFQYIHDEDTNTESLKDRLDRIESLQGIYTELWSKTMQKIGELKQEFKNTLHKIILHKRKTQLPNKFSDDEDLVSNYSTATTIAVGERKFCNVTEISQLCDTTIKGEIEDFKQQYKSMYPEIVHEYLTSTYPKVSNICPPNKAMYGQYLSSNYSEASTLMFGENKSCGSWVSSDDESKSKRTCKEEFPKMLSPSSNFIIIGPNGTTINVSDYYKIEWVDATSATRKLLKLIFGDEVLSTHSLSGKPSPAFYGRERPPKKKLDPLITADIIYIVTLTCKVAPKFVRAAISSKCSDSTKKFKRIRSKEIKA